MPTQKDRYFYFWNICNLGNKSYGIASWRLAKHKISGHPETERSCLYSFTPDQISLWFNEIFLFQSSIYEFFSLPIVVLEQLLLCVLSGNYLHFASNVVFITIKELYTFATTLLWRHFFPPKLFSGLIYWLSLIQAPRALFPYCTRFSE